jgi:hypothetical protein
MKVIQYRLTDEEEDLINLAMTSSKNKHLLDHKRVYMKCVTDAIKSMTKK